MSLYDSFSGRKEAILKVQSVIIEHFGHWETSLIPVDRLEQTTESFIERAEDATNKSDYLLLLLEYLGLLNNGHTFCFDQTVVPFDYEISAPLGFSIEYIEGSWVTASSHISGLHPGDRLEFINNEYVNDFIEDKRKYCYIMNNYNKTARFNRLLPSFIRGSEYTLGYRNKANTPKQMKVDRNDSRMTHPEITSRWIEDKKIAYIRIPSFYKPEYEDNAIKLVNAFGASETLIIDVGNNQGGSTPYRLISALMDKPWRWWVEKWRRDQAYTVTYYNQPKGNAYTGNLVILTDRNTLSAAEDFVMPFKDNHRAVIIGERTYGSTGQPYFTTIESIFIGIGSKRARFPDGTEFEGIGIEPDIILEKKIAYLYDNELFLNDICRQIHVGKIPFAF